MKDYCLPGGEGAVLVVQIVCIKGVLLCHRGSKLTTVAGIAFDSSFLAPGSPISALNAVLHAGGDGIFIVFLRTGLYNKHVQCVYYSALFKIPAD